MILKIKKISFIKFRTFNFTICCIWYYATICICKCGGFIRWNKFSQFINPVPLGIVCGLFFGKHDRSNSFSYISIKLKFAEMPNSSDWLKFYGVTILTGIGFTMSLFVGNLAFVESQNYLDGVKIGVLTGSLLSTLLVILYYYYLQKDDRFKNN